MLLHEYGYEFIKMGEEALVNLETFTMSGKNSKAPEQCLIKLPKPAIHLTYSNLL